MNKEVRRKDREVTDRQEMIKIISEAKVLRLGLLDRDFPYIVPLHYGYEYDENKDVITFYMHSAKEGHKIDLIKANAHAFIELDTDVEPDSGEDIPCRYGSFYASVMGQGHVSIVENPDEKKRALTRLMTNQTGRTFEFTDAMVNTVAVIKVEIKDYTAKARRKKI